MILYDSMMERLRELLAGSEPRVYAYDEAKSWPEHSEYQMIFQKDVQFELGGGGKASANLTCVTTTPEFFQGDRILVYGPELGEITGPVSYARICEVLVSGEAAEAGEDTDRLYKLVQDVDFVKYHVFPKGFMLRTSGQSGREQVRVSKVAWQEGISFEGIGNAFLSHYKKLENVLAVHVIFITAQDVDFAQLQKEAKLAAEVRNSLSMMQKGLPTECGSCSIREICNEVEGLRELHFGKKSPRGKEKSPLI